MKALYHPNKHIIQEPLTKPVENRQWYPCTECSKSDGCEKTALKNELLEQRNGHKVDSEQESIVPRAKATIDTLGFITTGTSWISRHGNSPVPLATWTSGSRCRVFPRRFYDRAPEDFIPDSCPAARSYLPHLFLWPVQTKHADRDTSDRTGPVMSARRTRCDIAGRFVQSANESQNAPEETLDLIYNRPVTFYVSQRIQRRGMKIPATAVLGQRHPHLSYIPRPPHNRYYRPFLQHVASLVNITLYRGSEAGASPNLWDTLIPISPHPLVFVKYFSHSQGHRRALTLGERSLSPEPDSSYLW
ncbi:hypothetical protein J6590_032859 [Homalodisca vitripennis]|nr:hypothetical protein J6590_032859 [Homalodisca vitripennis]